MKIAISSMGTDIEAQIDPRFGRCAHFILVETDDMTFEAFENESIALSGGAGTESACFMASKGAKTVVTGSVGPKAARSLSAAGIEVITGQSGTIRKAVEEYKLGNLAGTGGIGTPNPNGGNSGVGGGGRGMGRGGGMGHGGGFGKRGQ